MQVIINIAFRCIRMFFCQLFNFCTYICNDSTINRLYIGYLNNDVTYAKIGAEQYNLVTAENGCKWSATEPQENKFDFTQCDYIYYFAKNNSMIFRGHNLCWGVYNPNWLTQGGFSPDQLKQILQNHITTVMQHYSENNAYSWDVVNEAVSDSPSPGNIYKTNVWYPAIPDYVDLAFQYAKQANPDTKLFYNDYNILMDSTWMKTKSDTVYQMIKNMTSKGIKVDGIGFQAHVKASMYPLNYDSIVSNFQRFADLGLEIHVTEMDVSDPQNDQTLQANMYNTVLRACRAVKSCKSFETWGYTDKYTWLGESNHPLPFDQNEQPKQAAYTIEAELLNSSTTTV